MLNSTYLKKLVFSFILLTSIFQNFIGHFMVELGFKLENTAFMENIGPENKRG